MTTDNIGKYAIGNEQGREVKDNPFPEREDLRPAHEAARQDEEDKELNDSQENQMLKKKPNAAKEAAAYTKNSEEIGIAGAKSYEYNSDTVPEDLFTGLKVIFEYYLLPQRKWTK